jgi:hypothetical protein
MDGFPHATADPFSINLKVSEAACVWMWEVNAWSYGCTGDCLNPFLSNLKVSEAACVWMWSVDACKACATCDCLTPFSSNPGQWLHICGCGSVDGSSMRHVTA